MFTIHSLPIMYAHVLYVYTHSRHAGLSLCVPTLDMCTSIVRENLLKHTAPTVSAHLL